jgi:hypothetical protein
LKVHPVSIVGESAALLDAWFEHEIAPLYGRHRQLADESVRRKIAALRETIEAALRSKLSRAEGVRVSDVDGLREVEKELRRAAGRIPEETTACLRASDQVEKLQPAAVREAASRIIERWRQGRDADARIIDDAIIETAASVGKSLSVRLSGLAQELTAALQQAAGRLDTAEAPQKQELLLALREMPQLDFSVGPMLLKRSPLAAIARPVEQARLEARLRRQLGPNMEEAFKAHRRLLEAWLRRAIGEMQARFDSHADTYRAQLERLLGASAANPEAAKAIRKDLADIQIEAIGAEEGVTTG